MLVKPYTAWVAHILVGILLAGVLVFLVEANWRVYNIASPSGDVIRGIACLLDYCKVNQELAYFSFTVLWFAFGVVAIHKLNNGFSATITVYFTLFILLAWPVIHYIRAYFVIAGM